MEINLPQGSDWIDYWSQKSYPGGSVVEYDTRDVEKLPIFVRAGHHSHATRF
jgi:alpha-D-xyloside xylohydrolase